MNIISKSTLGALVAVASIGFSQVGSAALSSYGQDFTGFDGTSNLGPDESVGFPPVIIPGEGYNAFADVWNDYDGEGNLSNFAYSYGAAFAAPNGGAGFSAVADGEGDGPYLNIYSDYNNADHANVKFINSSVFQVQTIGADDIGDTWTFSGWFKAPSSGGIDDQLTMLGDPPFDITSLGEGNYEQYFADAAVFVLTLDEFFNATNNVRVSTTDAGQAWEQFSIAIDLTAPELEGQTLQFGFNTVATLFQNSGVYYDNLCFNNTGGDCGFTDPNVIPVPAAAWLFGSALLGLAGIGRRRRTA